MNIKNANQIKLQNVTNIKKPQEAILEAGDLLGFCN
jgi:hypothetical protein